MSKKSVAYDDDIILRIELPNISEIEKELGLLSDRASHVLARSINRAMTAMRTHLKKAAQKQYALGNSKQTNAAFRRKVKTIKAYSTQLRGLLIVSGRPLLIKSFNYEEEERPRIGRDGKVKREARTIRVPLVGILKGTEPTSRARAFVEKNLPMQRPEGAKNPPDQWGMYGPSVPQMLGNPTVQDEIEARGLEVLLNRIEHEIQAEFRGYVTTDPARIRAKRRTKKGK